MKPVLLIYPPFESKTLLKSREPFPIGLLYIAAYLKSKGIKSKIIDFGYPYEITKVDRPKTLTAKQTMYRRYGRSDEQIRDWFKENIKKYHKVVGLSSLMSSTYNGAYQVAKILKEVSPTTTIVIGGPHATAFPDHVSKNSQADVICIGEGEVSFYNFLEGEESEGIVLTKDILLGKVVTYDRQFIEDMDSLPFPDRNLLPDDRELKEMVVTFSRGCPHNCSFCGSRLIQGRVWRNKSVKQVIKELKFYINEWGIKKFAVEDDNLCPGNRGIQWLKEVCTSIVNELPKIRLHVPHGLPVYATADKELCSLLWAAGFRNMVFPLESTNKDVLKDMKKEFTPTNWDKAIQNWKKYEEPFPTEIIIGYPFVETIETMLQTIMDISNKHGLVWASHFRLNKGTELFDRCLKAGYIDKSFDPINTQSFYISTERFSIKDLSETMQISRAVNFGIERGFDPFSDNPSDAKFSDYTFIGYPKKIGGVVAKGKFGFNRSQKAFTGLLLARLGISGKPTLSFNDNKTEVVYNGSAKSNVYAVMQKMLSTTKKIIAHDEENILKYLRSKT